MKRFSYDVGINGTTEVGGCLMASDVKKAHIILYDELTKVNINSDDISHLILEHVDGDDVLAIQYEAMIKNKVDCLSAMEDLLNKLNLTVADIKSGTASTIIGVGLTKEIGRLLDL
jgi:hypothetical protein